MSAQHGFAATVRAHLRRRFNICLVAPHAYPVLAESAETKFVGGAEVQQVIVGKELARRGHRVSMICLDHGQPDRSVIDGIEVITAYKPNAGIPVVRFLWPRLTSLWRCLKIADADVYYTRTADMRAGVIAEFCRRYGRKSVFAGAGNPDFEKRTARVGSVHHRLIYEYGVRHVDCVMAQNEEQRILCARNFGRESVLVRNCYPDPGASSGSFGGPILWVSNIRTLKRPALVFELARALPHRRFRMIGGATAQEKALFAQVERQAGEFDNVEFLGFVPYSEIDSHFDGACAFINTSESEGFPNTFLQAWARGIPSVSFIDSGARLEGEPVGGLVGDVRGMAEAVEHLASNRELWLARGQLARRYYERFHKPETVIDLYEQVFDELMGS